MAKLTAQQVNTLKAIIEGGAGKSLYNRLAWNKPKLIRLSREEKDIISWHITENDMLSQEYKQFLEQLIRGDRQNGRQK